MDTEDLRLRIYDTFRRTGRAPSKAELAVEFNASEDEVVAGLRALHADRHIVLDRNGESESILFAYPFSSAPMGFSVMGKNTLWWGGCAWDSFVLANLLPEEGEMLIATRCLACNTPHAWNVGAEVPPEGEQVAHFLTPGLCCSPALVHVHDDGSGPQGVAQAHACTRGELRAPIQSGWPVLQCLLLDIGVP